MSLLTVKPGAMFNVETAKFLCIFAVVLGYKQLILQDKKDF